MVPARQCAPPLPTRPFWFKPAQLFQRKDEPLQPLLLFKAMSCLHRVRKASERKPFNFTKGASSVASQENTLPHTSRHSQVVFGSSRAQKMIATWMNSKASSKTPNKRGKKQKRKMRELWSMSPNLHATPTAKRRSKSASVHLKMDEEAVQRVRVTHDTPSCFVSRRFRCRRRRLP